MADIVSVLLVDDEPDLLDFLSKRLTKRGFDVRTASGGFEALEILEKTTPDVVVLDVLMPGMDGLATLREIRHRHPKLEVVMLTGHGSTDSALQGMELGAYDYLLKPVAIGDLTQKIEEASGRRGFPAPAPDHDPRAGS